MVVSMTCRSTIRTVDHLSESMITYGHWNTLDHIKLHRTKCYLKTYFACTENWYHWWLQNKKYATIIDESTDISTQKHLYISVRYLSDKTRYIVTGFIGIVPLQEATKENKFKLIDEKIKRYGQSPANCVGFVSDGASNIVRGNNSVWSRLQDVSPFCVQLIRCPTNSLVLGIPYPLCKLASNVGFLLSGIPSSFRHSLMNWG